MRYGDGSGLSGIVNEITLGITLGFIADNLDRVFIGADRAVTAQSVKHGIERFFGSIGTEGSIPFETAMADVVMNADGELIFGLHPAQFVENRFDHGRREFLRRQAVTAADHSRQMLKPWHTCHHILRQGRQYILIQRFAVGARFFGSIQYRNGPYRFRQRIQQGIGCERTEQSDLDQADFLSPAAEMLDRFLDRFGTRTHQNNDLLGVFRTEIIE